MQLNTKVTILTAILCSSGALLFAQTVAAGNRAGCLEMTVGQDASLNGFQPFKPANAFNQDVTAAPVDPSSATWIAALGASALHPDFGSGLFNNAAIGIPYTVVNGQARVPIVYTAYGNQSDPGPMPIPANAPVEGAPNPGDQHVLVLDQTNCFLYELYGAAVQADGSWQAASGAIWDLLNEKTRPYGWTSADAAGLPIFPGLARYDEYATGAIHHALRFTLGHTANAYVAPATHQAGTANPAYPPMGSRFRLKASYDISGFSPQAQVILKTLQTYGMILADNGSNLYLSGAPDSRWNNDDLHHLQSVFASAFEVVDEPGVSSAKVPQGNPPVILSFIETTLKPQPEGIKPGAAAHLSWQTTGADSFIVSPEVGVLRDSTVTVRPLVTTTYTLYATNPFGRTTRTVNVNVK